jgi:hypothetical protein
MYPNLPIILINLFAFPPCLQVDLPFLILIIDFSQVQEIVITRLSVKV